MKKIAVIGGGKIGYSIWNSLQKHGFEAILGDIKPISGGISVDASDYKSVAKFLNDDFDAVLCATPYFLVKNVAKVANDLSIPYFDLTEDRDSTDFVKSLEGNSIVVPQCGLAPGAVSIIANHLIKEFATVKSIDIRVGALPVASNNPIQYYRTWSTSGLINEYCNSCEIVHNGSIMEAMPLDGYETINHNGEIYEAFNTSGGVGSLCQTLEGKVRSLNYKTIRYVGHHQLMKFLLQDLDLASNKELFIKLFDQEVPETSKDVVVIMVKVVGKIGDGYKERTYFKKIYGTYDQNAIQRTTVSGICGVMMSWLTSSWDKKKGFVKQEEIDWCSFTNNSWGEIYLEDK